MGNYLLEIETEYARGRGRPSRLSPMDWNLAQQWWDGGIPLHVVLGAMDAAFKSHAASDNKRPINSLKYFTGAVEEKFDQWKSNQVGKSPAVRRTIPDLDEIMKTLPAVITGENAAIVRAIADALPNCIELEPLASAIASLRGELHALADDTERQQLSGDAIETRLIALRVEFEPSLIVSASESERAAIIAQTRRDFGKFNLLPEAEHKVLIRKIYQKFGLPELTLYAL